jgi:uncharacterized membrane protein
MRLDLKKSFITGLFAIVPLVISVWLLVGFFRAVDGFFSPIIDGVVGVIVPGAAHIPGTGILAGLVIILVVGLFARNVVGAKALRIIDDLINRIPGYRTVYSAIKQMTSAFSPENTRSFKEVMLVQYPKEYSYALGFRMETVELEGSRLAVVFVPTNHLYLGEVLFIPEEKAIRLDITVEQAIRILVSGGIAAPKRFSRFGAGNPL